MGLTRMMQRRTASLWLAVCLFTGCTNAELQPPSQQASATDSLINFTGTVCTSVPNPADFPVKVVFIVDQSGSMCISDPPGSQNGQGFCEQAQVQAIIPPGVTQPARVRALEALLTQFKTQPNVQVSLVPFETNVQQATIWPQGAAQLGCQAGGGGSNGFAPPDATLDNVVTQLQSQLGKGTDYQGVLSYVTDMIGTDITCIAQTNPGALPRTRYVVVFLTDGTPYPRCAADDTLPGPWADPDHPWLLFHSDVPDFCHLLNAEGSDTIVSVGGDNGGFTPGTDRNQNYQLFSYVDQIMQLQQQYNVGDIRFHTVLLYNIAAITACGAICQDVYGTYPGLPPSQYAVDTEKIATWLLQQMAARGNGVYQEFLDGNIQSLGLGALNYASLASRNVVKQLLVQNMTAYPGTNGWLIDSDGDGLTDDVEFSDKTNPFQVDSDGDCFSDGFEILHASEGFDPLKPDSRGCVAPTYQLCTSWSDTDGDGLSECEENYLGTSNLLVNSNADGIPDGIKAKYGLNPMQSYQLNVDTDGDGIADLIEMRAGSSPVHSDRPFYQQYGYQYSTVEHPNADGSTCYDFTVSNVQMVTPPSNTGQEGYNLFKIYFAEAPESGYASDYGVWRTACAWTQYDPPVRNPVGPELTFTDSNFVAPFKLTSQAQYLTSCVGTPPN
jgi:hypothetical protein